MDDKIRRRERIRELRDRGYRSYNVMSIIRYEDSGVDITNLCGPEFSSEQMKEVYLAAKSNIDVSALLDTSIPVIYMKWIRKYLSEGIEVDIPIMLETSITCIRESFYAIRRIEKSEYGLGICS